MKLFLCILSLTFAAGMTVRGEIPAGWDTNYTATLAAAAAARKPVLVYFTASWCGPCKLMSRITLTDPSLADILTNLDLVAVDIDDHPNLAKAQNVSAVPTLILLANANDAVERRTGFQAIGDFLPWLTNGIAEAQADMVRRGRVEKELAEIDRLLASTATNATRQAAATLFDLCDERDPAVVQHAGTALRAIADRDPSALLAGLNDPRLATRLQVANVLRARLGDEFEIDPWSSAATRQKQVLGWQERLEKTPGQR